MAEAATRVLVVEDEPLMRDLLTRVLDDQDSFEVVGSAVDGASALALIGDERLDVILLDLHLGSEPDELTVGHRARNIDPELGIVVLTGRQDFGVVREVILGEGSGWSFLLKQSVSDIDALARAIRGAAAGITVIDPIVVSSLRPREDSLLASLTPKQREVLELVAQGHNNDAIAGRLEISTRTVDRHLNEIYRRLRPHQQTGTHARVHAVLVFLQSSDSAPAA